MSSNRKFESGAERSGDAEATRYDLISPIALRTLAETYAEGAAKYGEANWELGMPAHDLLNHAIRHIFLFLSGDRSEPHLPHAFWNVGAAIHSLEAWPELNEPHLRGPGCTVTEAMRRRLAEQREAKAGAGANAADEAARSKGRKRT
jgi:hypothetical protein